MHLNCHFMKTCGRGVNIKLRSLLFVDIIGEWLGSRSSYFTSRELSPSSRRIGSCVGPRTSLEAEEADKSPTPPKNRNPFNVIF